MSEISLKSENRLFVHLCPVCDNWQVEYTEEVFLTDASFAWGPDGIEPDLTACHQMVEDVLADHWREDHL